jgi:hypothetical protein
MGNRAVITFDKKPTPQSIGIYLHWNGGPESVLAFLEAADKLNVRTDGEYKLARVVQIIGNFFGGTTSIGVGRLETLDCENHDKGVFAVSRKAGNIKIRQSVNGKTGWRNLDTAAIKKHPYWHPAPGGTSILENILNASKNHFKEE